MFRKSLKQLKALAKLSQSMSRFVVASEGNVSMRNKNGFWIKASGKSLHNPSFVECDVLGSPLVSDQKPSMEVGFHAAIYSHSNHDVIAHTHPTNTLKILCSNRIDEFANKRLFPDHVVFNGRQSCVISYVEPGKKLAEAIAQKINEVGYCPELFLLQNHGIICCAKSVEHAIAMTEICEKAAEIFLGSSQPRFLTPFNVYDISKSEAEHYRWNMNL